MLASVQNNEDLKIDEAYDLCVMQVPYRMGIVTTFPPDES
jgi:hypothetical protein